MLVAYNMNMKKLLIILIIVIIAISCKNDKIKILEGKINELKIENAELKNKINQNLVKKLTSSYFVASIETEYLTVGKEERIKISLITKDTIPRFDVFNFGADGRKLIMEDLNTTEFFYSFTPKSIYDNKIDLTAELELENEILSFPIFAEFDVRK